MNLFEAIKAAVHATPKTETTTTSGWGDTIIIQTKAKYATVMATNGYFAVSSRVRMSEEEATIAKPKNLYAVSAEVVRNAKYLNDIFAKATPGDKRLVDHLNKIIDEVETNVPAYEMNAAKLAAEVADAKDLDVSISFTVEGETVLANYEPNTYATRDSLDSAFLEAILLCLGPSEVFLLTDSPSFETPVTFFASQGESETTVVAMKKRASKAKHSVSPLLTQHEKGHWLGYIKTTIPALEGKSADELATTFKMNITYASTEPPFPECPKDGSMWLGMDFASRLTKRRVAAKALRELTKSVCELAA